MPRTHAEKDTTSCRRSRLAYFSMNCSLVFFTFQILCYAVVIVFYCPLTLLLLILLLKVQYVILIDSGWNRYRSLFSKYWREFFPQPTSLQIQYSHGLPDWGHATGTSALAMEGDKVTSQSLNMPLVKELFRWMLRPYSLGRIYNLSSSSFVGFYGSCTISKM